MTTISTPFGRAAIEVLASEIERLKGGDQLAPVTVAVPSNYAGLSVRRLLGSRPPGIANVNFMPLARVAELVGAPSLAAAGRRPLSAAVEAEAIRAVLDDQPGPRFQAAAHHPATERSLARVFAELRRCRDAALESLRAAHAPGTRAAEVLRLFDATRARLASRWYDEHDLAVAAARAIRDRTAEPALTDVGHVVVWLPRRPSAPMLDFIAALGEADPPRATLIEGDAEATLTDALHPPAHRIIGAADPDDEVREAIRAVMAAAALGGTEPTPLHRIAVLYGADQPYALVAHQQLEAAGIPHNGPGVRTLAATVPGTALLRALALHADGWRRDDVAAWLASAPILDPATKGGHQPRSSGAERARWVKASAWDRISRQAGVIATAPQWLERLDAHAARSRAEAAQLESDPDASESRLQARQRDAELADELRAFMAALIPAATPPEGTCSWSDLITGWAEPLLTTYLRPDRGWPDEQAQAFDDVLETTRRLACLDDVGRGCDADRFRRTLERELATSAGRLGTFGDGVLLAPIGAGRGVDVDLVVLVGLTEGTLPGRMREDALLPDADRRPAMGELRDRAARLADERADYLAALAAASTSSGDGEQASPARVLTWPRADLRGGRTRLPSRWLLEAATALHPNGERVFSDGLDALAHAAPETVRVLPSFPAALATAPEPASLADRDLATLHRWSTAGGEVGDHPLLTALPNVFEGLAAADARAGDTFTRFDGKLPAGLVPAPSAEAPISPTALESYAACPRRYLYSRVLGLNHEDSPEDLLTIDPAARGTLVHEILERYVAECIAGATPSRDRLLAVAEACFADAEAKGLTGKPLHWEYERRVLRRELATFSELDVLVPVAAELAFGTDGNPPVIVDLASGRQLAFRGRADRVDHGSDGGLVVTDYKTGSLNDDYRTLDEEFKDHDPVARGTLLQLPIYGLAARDAYGTETTPVRSRYWFVSERGRFREVGYPLDDERLARFHQVLEVLAEGIAAGSFPARPGELTMFPKPNSFSSCKYCDFDSLCSPERDTEWHHKSRAPELRAYVALAEGDDGA